MMTFNVLEYCRAARAAARLLVDARGLRRRPPVRRIRRGDRRLRLHREPVLRLEDRLGGLHLLVRQVLRPPLSRLPLLERLRPLRQRPAADGAGDPALHPPAEPWRADHRLRRRREGARLHLHRRLHRRHRPRRRAARRGTVVNETINLAYGQGNTLVRAAELIAAELGVDAGDHEGAVARRRGDPLRRRHPQGARAARLAAGDAARRRHPARGRWFREWRAAHPDEDRRSSRTGTGRHRARLQAACRLRCLTARAARLAIFGPTATGKSAVAEALARAHRRRGRVRRLGRALRGLPVLTAAPRYPARLVGVVPLDAGRLGRRAISGSRTVQSTRSSRRAGRRSSSAGPASTSALRCRRSSSRRRPPPGERERWELRYDELGPEEAHALLAERDPAAAARVHANDRRRVVRGLELAAAGSSLAPARRSPLERRCPPPDADRRARPPGIAELDARIEARVGEMVEHGAVEEAREAWATSGLSTTARNILGLEEFATLPLPEAVEAVVTATKRLARYQRKWLRRLPVAATLAADRRPEEIADEIRRAGRRRGTSTSSLRSRCPPISSGRGSTTRTGSSRCATAARTGSRSRSGIRTARSPRCRATAPESPRPGSPS